MSAETSDMEKFEQRERIRSQWGGLGLDELRVVAEVVEALGACRERVTGASRESAPIDMGHDDCLVCVDARGEPYSHMTNDDLLRAVALPSLLTDGQNRVLVPVLAERLKKALKHIRFVEGWTSESGEEKDGCWECGGPPNGYNETGEPTCHRCQVLWYDKRLAQADGLLREWSHQYGGMARAGLINAALAQRTDAHLAGRDA